MPDTVGHSVYVAIHCLAFNIGTFSARELVRKGELKNGLSMKALPRTAMAMVLGGRGGGGKWAESNGRWTE